MIEFHAVDKIFSTVDREPVAALNDVTLTIPRNQFLSVVGPSGCGKSTLLRLVAGLLSPTRGNVSIEGEPVNGPRPDLGFVFQAPTLLPWSSVLDNVLLPLRLMRSITPESVKAAKEILDLVGLADFERRYPAELSGGMQQRVAICRALLHRPSVLLMDEPFGALDALTKEEIALELLRIWEAQPKTVVFVTHSIPEAVLLSDRVIVMTPRPGRILADIGVQLARPRTFNLERDPEFQRCTHAIRELIFGVRVTSGRGEKAWATSG
jgi:NitT/TauT family transport system ATP-binding protein